MISDVHVHQVGMGHDLDRRAHPVRIARIEPEGLVDQLANRGQVVVAGEIQPMGEPALLSKEADKPLLGAAVLSRELAALPVACIGERPSLADEGWRSALLPRWRRGQRSQSSSRQRRRLSRIHRRRLSSRLRGLRPNGCSISARAAAARWRVSSRMWRAFASGTKHKATPPPPRVR
jgi:hypothetical protein